ncbi:hypothetical protein, partial [Agrobacterium vitis]|uniref:hypothetical protein n=1 Tax=Agrobacterium vitis TaxID=373 RepID=UPI001AED1F96
IIDYIYYFLINKLTLANNISKFRVMLFSLGGDKHDFRELFIQSACFADGFACPFIFISARHGR